MSTTEEIKVEVNATDNATAVIMNAAEQAEAAMKKLNAEQEKALKQTQKNFRDTKASAEFFGTIANLAGGSELAGLASQMAGLTEKTSQFNEVAKAGGSAALAMKVGLAAAAAAISFEIGKAIGDIIFETEKWNRELERAEKTAKKLESRRLSALSEQASDFRSGLEFDDNSVASVQDRISQLGRNMNDLSSVSIPAVQAELEKLRDAGSLGPEHMQLFDFNPHLEYLKSFVDGNGQLTKEAEEQLASHEATLELYRQEKHELERLIGIEREREKLRKERAEAAASDSFITGLEEQLAGLQSQLDGTIDLTAMLKSTIAADRETALALMEEIEATKEAIKAKDELAKARQREVDEFVKATQKMMDDIAKASEKRREEERREQERIKDLKASEIERLQEELILLEQGKEAARAFRLEKQGLSEEDASQIAAVQSLLDQANATPEKISNVNTGPLNAVDQRILTTSGTREDPTKDVARNTENQFRVAQQSQEILAEMKLLLSQLTNKDNLLVRVVQ